MWPPDLTVLSASIMSEGRQCIGHQALQVTDSDLDSVSLSVAPGVQIRGQVHLEGSLNSDLSGYSISLSPDNLRGPFNYGVYDPIMADGSFVLKNVYDGNYQIFVGGLPDNAFIKSARLDGVDVLTAGVNIDAKQTPGSLDVVISPNGASVDGVISKDQQPFPGATVAIVPDPPHRSERRLFKSTTTDQNGHFTLPGLAPGDYKVFAFEKIESGAYTSPDFLQPYENSGESVHVTEGSHNTVQVDLIPASDQ